MKMKPIIYFVAFSLLFLGCAAREDIVTLDSNMASLYRRITTLERENAEMKKRLDLLRQTGEGKAEDLRVKTAEIQASLDRFAEEMQVLRGKTEEAEFLLKPTETAQMEQEKRLISLEKAVREQEERIGRIEGYLNLESGGAGVSGKAPAASPAVEPAKPLSENEAYAVAKQAFDRGEYEKSRTLFQDLLKNHPASIHADNAQFWIGESYYREKWYEKAILEYQKVIEQYPTGNKVQASLLKQGLAFQQLGDNPNARLILKELVRKYPDSTEAKIARQKLAEMP